MKGVRSHTINDTDAIPKSEERMYSSCNEKLWGQLSLGDNSYCCNKALVAVPSRGANCSLGDVLVTVLLGSNVGF